MSLEKLKDTARKFEQKEDWRKAIEVYLKAIQQIESGKDATPDLSLYNRVGDLYLKVGDTASAVRHYERAVELYADQGFFNNAIALCGKILRVNPGRTATYLHLARLHARKNVVIEAKRNLLEYLERMNAQGQLDEAFTAVKAFADQFSGSQDIRVMLVELLRAASRGEEAQEQLDKLAMHLESHGEAPPARVTTEHEVPVEQDEESPPPTPKRGGDLVFIDTGFSIAAGRDAAKDAAAEAPGEPVASLVEESAGAPDVEGGEDAATPESVGGFEATTLGAGDEAEAEPLNGLEGLLGDAGGTSESLGGGDSGDFHGIRTVDFEDVRAEGIEGVHLVGGDDLLGLEAQPAGGMAELSSAEPEVDLSDVLAESLADTVAAGAFSQPGPVELDFVAEPGDVSLTEVFEPAPAAAPAAHEPVASASVSEPAVEAAPADGIAALEQAVADRPDDPLAHRALGEALLAAGDARRAGDEFLFATEAYEAGEAWQDAYDLMRRLVELEPNDVRHYQKLVELAYRTGSRSRMLDAYLALAGTLRRIGEVEKSIAVYRRVADHDPGNPAARKALEELGISGAVQEAAPPAPPARPLKPTVPPAAASRGAGADFVDLGSLVLDERAPRDTRMRIEGAKPTDDEQKNFEEMLAEFKRGIEQNLEADDYQSHYDLGVAFKEMGLLDEAIAEFQKALRSPEGRLRTSEALGVAFFDKGQFGIAETVLRRAVDTEGGGDEAKIGLLYWLGRAAEEQGKRPDALRCYERALAVDIRFMDLGERVPRLAAERHA
ncbi:MAG TPA: tetratricopeptide repeat protein [Gemmatimonadales bacterium]